jgi:hypothetical protein
LCHLSLSIDPSSTPSSSPPATSPDWAIDSIDRAANMPAAVAPMRRLDFPEKLIQSGKGQTAQALLKRIKVSQAVLEDMDMADKM